jgi:hypothetical protein
MVAGIWLHERRADEAMRSSRVRLGLRFPARLDPAATKAGLSGLSGLPPVGTEVVFEVTANAEGIRHAVWLPAGVRASATAILTGALPGLRVSETRARTGRATLALRLFIPTPTVLTTDNPVAVSRTLLSGLAALTDEQVVIRWALRPGYAPLLRTSDPMNGVEREVERTWRQKSATPGFHASGLVLVSAPTVARARELAEHVASSLRSQRGSVGAIRITSEHGNRSLASLPKTTRTSGWLNTGELLGVLGWPLGDEPIPGVEIGTARELLVPRHVPREGRRLFIGRDASGAERPVALSAEAARHHMIAAGVSGSGKSTMFGGAVLSDIEQGYAGVVIDPKGDLIETILERVKPEHAERVVVLDAGDDARPVPGIDVLHGGDPDARADVLTRTLKSMFTDWGIRSETYGRLAIRTLGEVPGATLMDMGRLFADEPYRRAAIARLDDTFLISSWQNYEALSPAAKMDVVQAPMARVMALLSRPRVRAVLASPDPKLDVARLFAEKKFLLVSLAPGTLGEAATLVGSAVMFAAWASIEARVVLRPEKRHLINLYVDELATITNGLPTSFELIAERARGLGASLSVAVQTLDRVPEPTRSALLGNAATFITWRAPAEEATAIARQLPGLSADDVMALGRFEIGARVGTGTGSSVSVMTGRTEPLPPETGQAQTIRDLSARVYGPSPEPRAAQSQPEDETPLGRTRRQA